MAIYGALEPAADLATHNIEQGYCPRHAVLTVGWQGVFCAALFLEHDHGHQGLLQTHSRTRTAIQLMLRAAGSERCFEPGGLSVLPTGPLALLPGAFSLMRKNHFRSHLLGESTELSVGQLGAIAVRLDPGSLAESLLGMRAFQSFDTTATHFPIHRVLRFNVRRPIDTLYDDIAMNSTPRAHRIDESTLLLEGEGYLAEVAGRRKSDYTSGTVRIWATDLVLLKSLERRLDTIIGDDRVREEMFTIDWHFHSAHMGLSSVSFDEVADPELHDAAYPAITGGVAGFVGRYLEARETVLILQGPPGTGKTRLVRAILAAMSRRKGDTAKVLYTADKRALDNDELYIDFLTGEHDALVVEDADHLLGARANGNTDLHRFLTVADGVVRAQGRKIIFTTNLHNIGDIDEALIRPGRCFEVMHTRPLARAEVSGLLEAEARELVALRSDSTQLTVLDGLFAGSTRQVSLAAIYRAIDVVGSQELPRGK